MFRKTITAAFLAAFAFAGGASASTFTFDLTIVNAIGLSGTESQAVLADMRFAGLSPGAQFEAGTYTGELQFRQPNEPRNADDTTIGGFLALGGGTLSGFSDDFLDLTLSHPNINNPTNETIATFFAFSTSGVAAGDIVVNHDDGAAVFDDMRNIVPNDNPGVGGGTAGGPTGEQTTTFLFGGGDFNLLYVAANGNPSVLETELSAVPLSAVPLPAAGFLLLGGMGALGLMRRRQKT